VASLITIVNSFNKTEAGIFPCRQCFLKTFSQINFIQKQEMSSKKTNGVGLKKRKKYINLTQMTENLE